MLSLQGWSQIDPAKRDSFARSVERSARELQRAQESTIRKLDSHYREGHSAQKEKTSVQHERSAQNIWLLRIGAGVIFLAIVMRLLVRRRRT